MKHLKLSEDERRTLREMGVFHPPRERGCERKEFCG